MRLKQAFVISNFRTHKSVVSVAPFIGTVTIKSDLRIRFFLYPESKSTLNNTLLVKELIVLVVAIVAGI